MADYVKEASDFYPFICGCHGYKFISTFDDTIPGKLGCKGPEDKHYPNARTTQKIIQAGK